MFGTIPTILAGQFWPHSLAPNELELAFTHYLKANPRVLNNESAPVSRLVGTHKGEGFQWLEGRARWCETRLIRHRPLVVASILLCVIWCGCPAWRCDLGDAFNVHRSRTGLFEQVDACDMIMMLLLLCSARNGVLADWCLQGGISAPVSRLVGTHKGEGFQWLEGRARWCETRLIRHRPLVVASILLCVIWCGCPAWRCDLGDAFNVHRSRTGLFEQVDACDMIMMLLLLCSARNGVLADWCLQGGISAPVSRLVGTHKGEGFQWLEGRARWCETRLIRHRPLVVASILLCVIWCGCPAWRCDLGDAFNVHRSRTGLFEQVDACDMIMMLLLLCSARNGVLADWCLQGGISAPVSRLVGTHKGEGFQWLEGRARWCETRLIRHRPLVVASILLCVIWCGCPAWRCDLGDAFNVHRSRTGLFEQVDACDMIMMLLLLCSARNGVLADWCLQGGISAVRGKQLVMRAAPCEGR